MNNPFVGCWHYRSFRNLPQPVEDLHGLLFGEGDDFTIEDAPTGLFTGTGDFGAGLTMRFVGNSSLGNPMCVRFQGVGTGPSNAGWVYDYLGFLVTCWPSDIDEVPAIVGSVVRTMPHDDGNAAAGYIVSFVAVKKL
jgi:hypothetical protein